jgi:Trk K+ transport system NAD-binding subunit
LLNYRFETQTQRPLLPDRDHVVLVGLGSVGKQVVALLRTFQQATVVLTDQIDDPNFLDANFLAQTPLVTGNILKTLMQSNLETAKSIVVVTKDQMLNLEVGLLAYTANPKLDVVIRTFDPYFEQALVELLPQAKSLCAYALSAEAFAGAAFGENMLSLFCLNGRTILVAEYHIREGDTLVGKMLAQIAYGYEVVPIFLQSVTPRADDRYESIMPSDDEYLQSGDRLIVLASISGLQRIERGESAPPRLWRITLQALHSFPSARTEAEKKLARISGCDRWQAQRYFSNLPQTIELPLYDTQAHRLGHELSQWATLQLFPVS